MPLTPPIIAIAAASAGSGSSPPLACLRVATWSTLTLKSIYYPPDDLNVLNNYNKV
jgi:hypothetical protein